MANGLRPFALPRPDAARLPLLGTSQNGGAPNLRSSFPSLEVSKHTPSVKKSSILSTKKSPILAMCSGPPQYYNLLNRQAGCPLNLPLSSKKQPSFSLASGSDPGPSGPGLC
jgi:hypothetical protein